MADEARLTQILSDFARNLATDFPIQSILDQLVRSIVQVLPVSSSGVTLISEREQPEYLAASDPAALRFEQLQSELGEGPCLTAYTTAESVSIPDVSADLRFPRFSPAALEAGLRAVFTFPLLHGDACLGALDLYRDEVGALSERDLVVAQTLADVTTAYLLNATARYEAKQAAEHFQELSLHDSLTGLPNRILLQQRLEHATARSQRSRSLTAVLFIDLDDFKTINDSHGHHVGDELLRAVSARLKAVVRPGDTVSRVGGDEFVYLCEDVRADEDAATIVERVTAAFVRPFRVNGDRISVSASIGVALTEPGGSVASHVVALADADMYARKRDRRSQDDPTAFKSLPSRPEATGKSPP